jgi:hypothetical protein
MAEECRFCGVLDALERHAPDCQHAISIGLPRLAEGEEPIPPDEDLPNGPIPFDAESSDANLDRLEDRVAAGEENQRRAVPTSPSAAPIADRPGAIQRSPDAGLYTGLWLSWTTDDSGYFDAVVFGSELEALRYAVREGHQVVALELGRPLREQAALD